MGRYTQPEKSVNLQHAELYKHLASPSVRHVGCYLLGDTVGEGTYGKVKRAVHQLTGREVAVKIVDKIHAPTVIREIDTLSNLRHPHIAQIYEVLTTETKIYIVTELARGGEAFDYITNEGKLDESLAKRWFAQLVSAIGYCHKQDFVHRDLKLENILLNSHTGQNIKLIDFGFTTKISGENMSKAAFADYKQLDREIKQKKLLDTCCGSVAYAAPEMLRGEKYSGEQSDIWSLGVILYTLVCGYLPFDDDSERVVLQKILKLELNIPEFLSAEAKDLIASLLKLDPKDRLTMDEIALHPWFNQSASIAGRIEVSQDYMNSLLGPLRRNGSDAISRTEAQSPKYVSSHPSAHDSPYETPYFAETADLDGESGRAILSALSNAGLDVSGIVESIRTNTCNQGSALYRLLQKNKLDEERNRPALQRRLSPDTISDCALPTPPPSCNEGHGRHESDSSSIATVDLSMGFSKKRDLTVPTVSAPAPANQTELPARRRRYSMPTARPPPWNDNAEGFAKNLEIERMIPFKLSNRPTEPVSSIAEPVTERADFSEPCPLLSPAPVRSRHATTGRHMEPLLVDISYTAPEPTVRTPVPFRSARPPPTAAQRRIVRRRKKDRKGRMTISEESEDGLGRCETAEIMEDLSRMACVMDGIEGDPSGDEYETLTEMSRGWPRDHDNKDVQSVCEMVWEEEEEESGENGVGQPGSGSTLRRQDQFWRS